MLYVTQHSCVYPDNSVASFPGGPFQDSPLLVPPVQYERRSVTVCQK